MGSLISIPLGFWSCQFVMDAIAGDLMVMPIYIAPQTYFMSIIAALLASAFGIFSAYKRIMRLDLADAMRTRIAN